MTDLARLIEKFDEAHARHTRLVRSGASFEEIAGAFEDSQLLFAEIAARKGSVLLNNLSDLGSVTIQIGFDLKVRAALANPTDQ